MRTGAQTLDDFEDEHALWGYVNAVGSKRAFNVCETFAWLWAHLPPGPMSDTLTQMFARRPRRPLRVASLGGGPASCLLGWAVFERLVISGGDSDATDATDPDAADASATASAAADAAADAASAAADAGSSATALPRLHVLDYAPGWAPLVQRVADALGEPIGFGRCELTWGLEHPANRTLHTVSSAGLDLVLLVYALHECDHDRPGLDASGRPPHWAALLLDLWDAARPHTLFLIKDQGWVEDRALALLQRERPGGVASCVVPRAELTPTLTLALTQP